MTARSARPAPGRPRETYGDVGRIIEKPKLDWKDPEGNRIKGEAVMAAEPRRRYARVTDNDGHQWERGNTRWTCLTPVGTRGVTQVGRLGWSTLVDWYGPLTVVDENLPAPKPARTRRPARDDDYTPEAIDRDQGTP